MMLLVAAGLAFAAIYVFHQEQYFLGGALFAAAALAIAAFAQNQTKGSGGSNESSGGDEPTP